jgi:hypothetical protein
LIVEEAAAVTAIDDKSGAGFDEGIIFYDGEIRGLTKAIADGAG